MLLAGDLVGEIALTCKYLIPANFASHFAQLPRDGLDITEWYDYESGENTAVSPGKPLPGDIWMDGLQLYRDRLKTMTSREPTYFGLPICTAYL